MSSTPDAVQTQSSYFQSPLLFFNSPNAGKVATFVLGLLLTIVAAGMYYYHANHTIAYIIGAAGLACILGAALWSLKNSSKGSKNISLDYTETPGNPSISKEEVSKLLENNPHLKTLKITVRPHATDLSWNPNFSALEEHFTMNALESSGAWYIYDKKS